MSRRLVVIGIGVLLACGGGASSGDCPIAPGLSAAECELVRALELPATLPPARGNAVAESEDAAMLGFRIFFDARMSSDALTSCGSCHDPRHRFADALPTSRSLGPAVVRNSPSVLNAAHLRHPFWDGRADSLWSQPLLAFENEGEMNFTRLQLAHRIAESYRIRYERLFGPLPELSDTARFPARGKPGDPEFEQMAPADREAINRVAANVGKAIEAYERRAAAKRSPLDRHLAGEAGALSPTAQRGLAVLVRAGCLGCHSGPMMTDERYHNLGVPAWPGVAEDPGRAGAFEHLRASEFSAQSPFYDGPAPAPEPGQEDSPAALGAFRTPSLRNLTGTGPYMHNGRFETLEQVLDFHLQGGGRGAGGFLGEVDAQLQPVELSADERAALLELLRSMDGESAGPPWHDWPEF
jgi:cytochrome c peroxidase